MPDIRAEINNYHNIEFKIDNGEWRSFNSLPFEVELVVDRVSGIYLRKKVINGFGGEKIASEYDKPKLKIRFCGKIKID